MRCRDQTNAGKAAARARYEAKQRAFNLGLAISAATLAPGQRRTSRELAAYCEVSHQAIEYIEYQAIGKIRPLLIASGITGALT